MVAMVAGTPEAFTNPLRACKELQPPGSFSAHLSPEQLSAVGATTAQIRTQFLAESILLPVIGSVVGVLAGAAATAVYASLKSWAIVIPAEAWSGGIAAAILIGALAGLMPAVRASRMPPAVALRTV